MKRRISGMSLRVVLLFLLSTASSNTVAEDNYCSDPDVEREWKQLIVNADGAPEPRYLYNLRARLCSRVQAGELPVGAATKQFEDVRERVIRKMRERIKREHPVNIEQVG